MVDAEPGSEGPVVPPRPRHRRGAVGLLRRLRLFRADLLSLQPERLYRAWMAEYRGTFLRSAVCNDPDVVDTVLKRRPADFPKSARLGEGLAPLLGGSVFLANGSDWDQKRRMIDPAFDGGQPRAALPAMVAATKDAVARLAPLADGRALEIEAETSHLAADVILRAMFSEPVAAADAKAIFAAFRVHQRGQPLFNLGSALPLPAWMPRLHRRRIRRSAAELRDLAGKLVRARQAALARGCAPDDFATRLLTASDPATGRRFGPEEVIDQVLTFLLAGHETSAAGLAWALYLLAISPDWQRAVAAEGAALPEGFGLAEVAGLDLTRAVFREALRLYPPVPMLLRETIRAETLRDRTLPAGTQVVISPWYLHRHERLWQRPHDFDPARFDTANGRICLRRAFLPFSAGPRICPGAGFAMLEGVVALALLVRAYRLEPVPGRVPVPSAQITLRARDGIWLRLTPR